MTAPRLQPGPKISKNPTHDRCRRWDFCLFDESPQGLFVALLESQSVNRKRKLLSTTLTLENAIRAEAHIGVIWKSMPKR